MRHNNYPAGATRQQLVDWFESGRKSTRAIFQIPHQSAYYERPIALRNPIVFYEGHLPAFCVNTLIKLALRWPGIDERFEELFARGIDPESADAARPPTDMWPSRDAVQAYGREADRRLIEALLHAPIDDGKAPQRNNAEAAFAILEHEHMHQETFLYMLHQLPYDRKQAITPFAASGSEEPQSAVVRDAVRIPAGQVTLGTPAGTFGWDNELAAHTVEVPSFAIDRHNVTNRDYLRFVEETGAAAPHFWTSQPDGWYWRGMFELLPLPLDWPVFVTQEQADAFARWKGGRVPTEAEYHRAAFGTPSGEERSFPWGEEAPDPSRGNFGFQRWDPAPIGSFPKGTSAWGVHDLVGNGWEWTSTLFEGFPGFQPMASYPVYSEEFFDGKHFVLKGASPVTDGRLTRRSFRNWFRSNYPYVYATFRCVWD